MSFWLQIQADHGSEVLSNVHPEGKPSGGKAIMAFLTGLWNYSDWLEKKSEGIDTDFDAWNAWFETLEKSAGVTLFPACKALVDCMWGDGGDPTEFHEDEFEFFRHRYPDHARELGEAGFLETVRASKEHWQPIKDVAKAIQLLLTAFERGKPAAEDGLYVAEDSIPDFEALAANLDFLIKRGHEVVRLNFN